MADLDLIHQLGNLLGRSLGKIAEYRFERHSQAKRLRDGSNRERITRDSYSLAGDGTVSGLFLQPVTSELLFDFPFQQFSRIKYLHLSKVNLSDYSFLSGLTELTSLDLRNNDITDCSFLSGLTELTSLDLRNNDITDCSFLSGLTELTSLDLRNNDITDCSFLSGLTELTSLDLSYSRITDCSFLSGLTGLTTLLLSSNSIVNWSFLRELTGLTTLDLRNSRITDCSFLSGLTGLTTLLLSSNSIVNWSFLRELTGLTTLDLSSNSIMDWSFLRELTGLTTLDLSSNSIMDWSFLRELTRLTTLDLSSNSIMDWSFLRELTGLTTLDLRSNNITDCSFLRELTGLTTLFLSYNRITDWSFLERLTRLTTLDLSYNRIRDCSFLERLTGLTTLFLRNNRIRDCSFLRELTGLTTLDLSSNRIADWSFLRELTRLTTLDLRNNSITDCSFLRELTGLTMLFLNSNSITDCSFLKGLTGLTTLFLSYNKIIEIPRYLAAGRLAIEIDDQYGFVSNCIHLYGNPVETPPLEIVSQANIAILSYYAQSETQGQDHLYEAKMLIVGEGEAGKTTLAHKISEPNCPLPHIDDRTRGISIKTHTFSCRNRDQSEDLSSRNFHLNIWDFGGQEIYHATHRFFLSKRSLYVLVADNRKDHTDFNYWLNIIEHFAGKSPLIIVLNAKGDIQRILNQADLRGRYSDTIKEVISVNFRTREEPDENKIQQRLKGISKLIRHIEHHAQNLPHIGEPVPARWIHVRQAIENDNRNYIYREQFDEICQIQDITASQDIDTLLGYFHDLGILLHFADNFLLRNRIILKPAWATNAVYRIFDDDSIKAKAGRFSRQDCASIWSAPEYCYMDAVLIELMKNFRLVYEIDNTGNLVAPQLLPQNTPTYDWDTTRNSHMQLRYDAFMPKGIFWQFAVTMYRYIDNHDWVWRNGMVIRRGNTWAEIVEDLNLRRISLRFSGPSIAEFRAVIVDELDKISQSYHQLQYDKMIPCQCSECKNSSQPHFFKYSFLKRRQEAGKRSTADCEISDQDVSLNLLLEGFEVQEIVEKLPDTKGNEPTPPSTSNSSTLGLQPTMQTIKIFLASSSELEIDRKEFESFIYCKTKEYIKTGIFLELVIWEDFIDAMSQTRLQDEYNKAIAGCDVFVSLFYSKVGQYTREEFLKALEVFKANGKPLIYTYFKDLEIKITRVNRKSLDSLFDFQDELSDKGHFFTTYDSIEDLKYKFGEQLVKFLPQLTDTSLR